MPSQPQKWKGNDPRESALVEVMRVAFQAGYRSAEKGQGGPTFEEWLLAEGKFAPLTSTRMEFHGVPRIDKHIAHVLQTTTSSEVRRIILAAQAELKLRGHDDESLPLGGV